MCDKYFFSGIFLFASLIAVCDEENTTSDQFGLYMWPLTIAGDTHFEQCVFKAGFNASRTCSQEGSWIAVNFVDCRMSKCTLFFY